MSKETRMSVREKKVNFIYTGLLLSLEIASNKTLRKLS